MTDLECIRQWLQTYPRWNCTSLDIDGLQPSPGSAGLYPQGIEEVSRQEDVLGNLRVHYRKRYLLLFQRSNGSDNGENAQWLADFQNWVQQQTVLGLAPRFGDVPSREQMQAAKGQLQKVTQPGTGQYGVTLIADYIKLYEVK